MSVVSIANKRSKIQPRIKIGLLRLTDSAPVILAQEFGFFAEENVDVELIAEPSWANIADKLAYGLIDAAVIVPPLAFAVELGLRGAAQKLIIPITISLGGNTVTLNTTLANSVRATAAKENISVAKSLAHTLREHASEPLVLGVVHPYSTHNLLLRYWLAAAGIDPVRDVRLAVVPPAQAVDALQVGRIAGFCAGAPWGEVAARAGVGATVATTRDIWQNAPEKAFAVRARWAEDYPEALQGVLRALLRAAKFCDAPENASYTAALLSRHRYVDVDSHAIMPSLPGGAIARDNVSGFFRHAATFPFLSHAQWFLHEMRRWNLIAPDLSVPALAGRVYRPDLYRAAAASLGISAPRDNVKLEGAHPTAWELDGTMGVIAMGPDRFCDGAVFVAPSLSGIPAA